MAAIITEKFRTHSAKQFIEDFGESASSTYMFIGRSFPWTDDTSPPTPANSVGENMDAFSDMVALKKVSSADVTHAISRKNWTSGTTTPQRDPKSARCKKTCMKPWTNLTKI